MSITFTVGLSTLTLPDPILGDGDELDIKTRFHRSMLGQVHSYLYTPEQRKLSLVFDQLKLVDVNALATFVRTNFNVEVAFTDWRDRDWLVRFLTNPLEFKQLDVAGACGFYETTLELSAIVN